MSFCDIATGRVRLLLNIFGILAVVATVTLGMLNAMPREQSQGSAAPAITFEYDVASIKLYKAVQGYSASGTATTPDGFATTNASLRELIQSAYGIRNYQLTGAPDWLDTERYDVNAKMEGSVADALQKLSPHDRRVARQQMLQSLLADRLKLTIHRDTKDLPVYLLVIAKNGPKLAEAKPEEPTDGKGAGGAISTRGNQTSQTMTAKAATITSFAGSLAGLVDRPITDKTGLTGKYDFTLQFAPDTSTGDSSAPALLAAIQEQLGLKLESGKGPVEIIVIDHIERPSEN